MVRGYLEHEVGKSAAALAYYLLFSFFPLLIFLSTLVGFLELEPLTLGPPLQGLIPGEVLRLVNAYLSHVTQLRSGNLLAASLLATIWLPMRAVDSLMKAVNTAYDVKNPRPTLWHQVVVLLFTLFLMAVMMLTLSCWCWCWRDGDSLPFSAGIFRPSGPLLICGTRCAFP